MNQQQHQRHASLQTPKMTKKHVALADIDTNAAHLTEKEAKGNA